MSNKTIAGATTSTSTPLPVANTIDGSNDYLPVYTANVTATQAINRATLLGVSGQPVDISSTQTLTNKIISISNTLTALDSTFTIQDNADSTKKIQFQASSVPTSTTITLTSPAATGTLITRTSTDTLTNKTLTSPSISGGTLDNTTVTVDSIAGHTTAGTGSIYGIGIASGAFTTSNIVPTVSLQAASVTPTKLATGATNNVVITAETTTSGTYAALATAGPLATVTIGSNGLALVGVSNTGSNSGSNTQYMGFAVSGASTIASSDVKAAVWGSTITAGASGVFLVTGLTPGSTTFTAQYRTSGGTATYSNRSLWVVPL